MLVRANARSNVVENRRCHNGLGVGYAGEFCCGGPPGGGGGEGNGVCEGNEDQGEGYQAPAVVADVVEFEVVGGEVELGGGTEPCWLYVSIACFFSRFKILFLCCWLERRKPR